MSVFHRTPGIIERIVAGRTDLVFDLARDDKPATARDKDGTPLISWCAYYGDVSAVRFLLANGERMQSIGPMGDLTAAAFHGHWRLCEFLLENGADVTAWDATTGETALHAALCKPNRPVYDLVVQVLLAAGADPHRPTIAGAATGSFMRDCRTHGETPLHRAAAFGSAATIQMLLDAGARKDTKDAHGDSPLSWASWHTRPDAILRLLCYNDFGVRSDRGSTFDHGSGWGVMEVDLFGRPLGEPGSDRQL